MNFNNEEGFALVLGIIVLAALVKVVSPFFKIAKTQSYQQSKLWIISS